MLVFSVSKFINNFLHLENIFDLLISQLIFTSSKSPIEAQEKGVKFVQS